MFRNKEFLFLIESFFVLSFIIIIQGTIPFYSIPTLGQIVWASGFAESFVQNNLYIYANNFGIPHEAAIAFGLPGAYIQAVFIKFFNLHASDAYAFMSIVMMGVALYGSIKFTSFLGLSKRLSLYMSLIYLTLPIIWWHTQYSFLAFGFAFLPLYVFNSFNMIYNYEKNKLVNILMFIVVSIIAIFMDGYTFIMFASATGIIFAIAYINSSKSTRKYLLFVILPIIIFSFAIAYFLYTKYLGISSFTQWPIDYFRGFGIDLSMFVVPTKGIIWIFDSLNLSISRSNIDYFGDASVWAASFILIFLLIGVFFYIFSSKNKYKISLLLISLFGLYMSLGPSLKINSTRPIIQKEIKNFTPSMKADEAICQTGSAVLSMNLPGFKSMRATYRWIGLAFVGLFGLIAIGINELICKKQRKKVGYFLMIILILLNLPNLFARIQMTHHFRTKMFDMDKDIIALLKKDILPRSKVAFVPYYNDHFANYLAAKSNIRCYNIGGDKNLEMAKRYWPKTMIAFQQISPSNNFIDNIKNILIAKDAEYVVIPYFDMLWSAYQWPRNKNEILQNKNKYKKYYNYFLENKIFNVVKEDLYFLVKLDSKANISKLKQEQEFSQNCNSLDCIAINISKYTNVFYIVGKVLKDGIITNNKAGTLLYGPYKTLEKGAYSLEVHMKNNRLFQNNKFKILITSDLGKNIIKIISINLNTDREDVVLNYDDILLPKKLSGIEIKFIVGKETNIKVIKYKMKRKG